ncbi:MAG: TetR/AcrR family transcriptional regulator [Propionicimonas sp.]|nr:TetR/AcrR family transcriptional regulator [Propionicimonas sp.]
MAIDGRDARWAEHRVTRRRELVDHAMRAIHRHGANVGMDEIAAQAGTSKTVIYRHFGDRAGLYAAIGEAVHDRILSEVTLALEHSDPSDLGRLTADLAEAYLALVERDPSLYRFLMSPPLGVSAQDPAGRVPTVLGDRLEAVLAARLAAAGQDPAPAATWGHGLVGFIRAAADRWMDSDPRPPRGVVVDHITSLFAPAFSAGFTTVPTKEYR